MYLRGADTIRELVDKCNLTSYKLKKPHLIRSTKLRRHVATVAQILVLNGVELGHLSNHLGLDAHKILAKLRQSGNKCWPYRASNEYLAGPIGPANDPLLDLSDQ